MSLSSYFARNTFCLRLAAALLLAGPLLYGQVAPTPVAADLSALPASCVISGRVLSTKNPLPGVSVTAANSLTGKKVATSTEVDGSYALQVPGRGRYVLRAELAAFAPATAEVVVNPANCQPHTDLEMTLLSRVQSAPNSESAQAAGLMAGLAGRGFQNLVLSADPSALAGVAGSEGTAAGDSIGGNGGNADPSLPGMPSGAFTSSDAATESVAVSGNGGRTDDSMFGGSSEELRQRIEDMRERARNGQLSPNDVALIGGQRGEGGGPGGRGGPGGGGPGIFLIGGRGRFNINQPHGAFFYSTDNAAFDAAPYSLTGQPSVKPDYMQQRFGAAIGGPLRLPKSSNTSPKTFFFLNYTGNRANNPYDMFSTVPTLAERSGDFSSTLVHTGRGPGAPAQIFDPVTHQPFPGNKLTSIDPAALGLLSYIPLPNLPGDTQNFHYVTSTLSDTDAVNVRLMHNFASGGMPFGRGPGGRRGPRNNLNFGLNFQRSDTGLPGSYPSISGDTYSRSWNVPVGWVYGKGRITNNLRFNLNRSSISTSNLYAFSQNITGNLGITGVSQDPFTWGLPALSFTNYRGLSDIAPVRNHNQTVSVADTVIWSRGKHTVRFGGDFRRIQLNTHTDKNAQGNFVFTGLYTSAYSGDLPVSGTGLDFADFLLGLAQQSSVQYGANNYHFRGNSWDLFVQDDWRLRGNLTLNFGLRYEYVSPFSELNNQIVNLDAAPGFTAVAPVQPGQVGPYTGAFPTTLVNPDRNNFAPRIGIAWKPFAKTVFRAGYGINYNTSAYSAIAQDLAFQPPFDVTQTNASGIGNPLPLRNAFPPTPSSVTTNNYGIDPNYRLGYVQTWNVDVQRELSSSLVLNLDYNGVKGTRLDMMRAPNRGPTGLRIPDVQAFLWESSEADSILHAAVVRLRKRLQHGVSVGGTYVFSKSIDNASSIGGTSVVVAQNDLDLAAERGLSSFNQPQRLTADYLVELPFGPQKRWLASKGIVSDVLGGWQWSGNVTAASGTPFTPRVLGNFADVSRGTNGTLRADVTGQPVSVGNPSVQQWFNTAAFVAPPPGQFGDARRNSISGPRTIDFTMNFAKIIPFGDVRVLEIRATAANIFNTPQFTGLDTTVNSRTFGQVIAAGQMRRLSFTARFRF